MGELLAHEYRDDGWRSLVGAETVLVARGRDTGAEQRGVLMHRLEDRGEEDQEANILMRRLPGLEQVVTIELRVVGRHGHRPVAVLARSVDAGKRLLVQQRLQVMPQRDTTQRRHNELVVIDGNVGLFEARCHLELAWRHFIVPRHDRNAELVQLVLDLGDTRLNALWYAAEVVILELLAPRRGSADERAAGHDEIRSQGEVTSINQEILLLGSKRGINAVHTLVAKHLEERDGPIAERVGAPKQRRQLVKRLAVITDEDGWNTKRL